LLAVWLARDEASIFDMTEISATTDERIVAVATGVLANPAVNNKICDFAEAKALLRRDSSALFIDATPEFGAVVRFIPVVEAANDPELAADINLLDAIGDEVNSKLDLPIGREELSIELSIPTVE